MSKDKTTPQQQNKKKTNPTAAGDPSHTQESMNELYTAHQVHTLANLVFRRLAGGWAPAGGPAAHAGFAAGQAVPCGPASWTGAPMVHVPPGATPGPFYWYP